MANSIDFILTTAADKLISKVLTGKTLNFTRMAVGDGFSYDINVSKGFTTLVNEILSLDIIKKETLSPKSVRITSAFKNTDAQKEFYYREVGLYAQDPDTGEEVLYAYGNRNDAAELITPTSSNVITKQLVFIISVGNSANVTFNVNAGVYALQEDITTLQADLDKLNSTKADKTQISSPYNFKGDCTSTELASKTGMVINDTWYITDLKMKKTWNGTAWGQSSLNESEYQEELNRISKEAKDCFLSVENLIDLNLNLIDYVGIIADKYVAWDTGVLYTNTSYNATDYIEIKEAQSYFLTHITQLAWYDSNKTYISGFNNGSANTVISPIGAKYIRISIPDEHLNGYVFCEGESDVNLQKATFKNGVLDENKPLNNKTINFIGDSITHGYDGENSGDYVDNPYPTVIANEFGANVRNYGITGCTLAGDGVSTGSDGVILGFNPIAKRYTNMDEDCDCVVVFAGTNDYGADRPIPLGTINDNTLLTFYGALNILAKGLIAKYPNGKILFVTPLRRSRTDANSYNHLLVDYVDAIKEVCEYYSIPCLDMYRSGGCYPDVDVWKNINLPDGLHPSQSYYNVLGHIIGKFIEMYV